jgi:hypothetical protein
MSQPMSDCCNPLEILVTIMSHPKSPLCHGKPCARDASLTWIFILPEDNSSVCVSIETKQKSQVSETQKQNLEKNKARGQNAYRYFANSHRIGRPASIRPRSFSTAFAADSTELYSKNA